MGGLVLPGALGSRTLASAEAEDQAAGLWHVFGAPPGAASLLGLVAEGMAGRLRRVLLEVGVDHVAL